MHDAELQLVHDLRNTAAVLHTAAQSLEHDHEAMTVEHVGRLAEMMTRRSGMLLRLLEDLALVQQLEIGDLEVDLSPVDLGTLCRDALGERLPLQGHSVTLDIAPGTVAHTDPMRLTQILDNLVTNALRYGGPQVTVRARRHGRWVEVQVEDDGSGVPPELEESMFEAHVRGPDSGRLGGNGLGLAIVRSLTAALGGSVAYDCSIGTRFSVTLPAAVAPRPCRQATPSSCRTGSMAK
jgi:signal transduction histidine kinase